jgi:hypothetical protein|tara:strand:+ start:1307 stop:1417 length:111 start_codon:yes stop_codon:yes gene_type:complete
MLSPPLLIGMEAEVKKIDITPVIYIILMVVVFGLAL